MVRRGFLLLSLAALGLSACRRESASAPSPTPALRFTLPQDAVISLQVERADGAPVRRLRAAVASGKGPQNVSWDGCDDAGVRLPPGEYRWAGLSHAPLGLKLRGWAAHSGAVPWETDDLRSGWGGDGGVPSAVCADAERVYLGWSAAARGSAVLACDLEGRVLWGWRGAGCRALAVDRGVLYVLAGAQGDRLVKLDARNGTPQPFPQAAELSLRSLWPASASVKPDHADGLAARSGRVYLAFTAAQFLTVLAADTGEYLQTVVGAPPELIDVTPTQTESPEHPGALLEADFAMIALRGGVLGKVLFAHDPLWVMASDLQPLEGEERITALTVLGDQAKHFKHSVFVGLAAPFQQVQRRSILQLEGFLWSAGRAGGRAESGPWQPEALGEIRGLALDARGRLWVAEGSARPPRFSVWDTGGREGRLVREFFGAIDGRTAAVALDPQDPDVLTGAGCQWRIDPKTGQAACVAILPAHWPPAEPPAQPPILGHAKVGGVTVQFRATPEGWRVETGAGLLLGSFFQSDAAKVRWPARAELGAEMSSSSLPQGGAVVQAADGRVYAVAAGTALWSLEVTGLETLRPLAGGSLRLLAVPAK